MIFEEKRYVMIKPIMKDEAFLAIKSVPATKMDTQVAQDLKDTLLSEGRTGLTDFTVASDDDDEDL